MGHGGAGNTGTENTDATKTDINEKLTALLLEYSLNNPALVEKTTALIESKDPSLRVMNAGETSPDKLSGEELIDVLAKDKDLLKTITDHLEEHPEELAKLLEQAKKVDGMEERLIALDEDLSTSSTLVQMGSLAIGALAGLAIAGPVGGLIGLIAAAAILIFSALFANRGEIKEGAKNVLEDVKSAGKGIEQSLKNFINKYSVGRSNAEEFHFGVTNEDAQERYNKAGNPLPDDAAFVGQYLLNKDGFQALKSLIAEKNTSNERDASKEKFTLKDEEGKKVELTLEDLKTLQNGGKGKSQEDKDKFKEELDKFKLLMTEANKDVRAQVEEKQDKIHEIKNLQTSIPSSPGYPGSRKNTELLKDVGDTNRRDVKNLLENFAELRDTGTDNGFKKDFHKFAQETHQLNTSVLKVKGSELESSTLKDLASSLNNLTPVQIKDLNAKVDELKKEQSKGPQSQTSQIENTPTQHAPPEITTGIPDR